MPFPLHRSSCLILITAPHSGCHVPILQLRKQSYFPKLKNLASSGTKTLARTHLWCSVHKSSKARPPWLAGESTLVRLSRKMPKSTPVVGLRVPSGCLSPPGRGHPSAPSGSAHTCSQSSTVSSAASCVLH